jgi:hypothetical protein
MTDLSPAAQAVLDAANNELDHAPWDVSYLAKPAVAAALRAAANEVCLRWAELQHPANVLNAIADELEVQP